MVSIFTYLPEFKTDKVDTETAPRVAVGAASPLWLMFGGAAAAGAAYWWWASRWREAVNLEALMALTPEPVAPAVEAQAVLDEPVEPLIQEAAPISETVVLAAEVVEMAMDAAEKTIEAVVEPAVQVADAANEDVAEAMVEPVVEAQSLLAETSETAVETVVEAAPAVAEEAAGEVIDDLTRLVGVGPKLAASLAELGVTKFSQIAAWTPDELASYDQLLNLKGRAERDAWIAQAKRFMAPA